MGLKKTHIGYHLADGGAVYKVGSNNSLISYFYCDYCKSSSTLGNLPFAEVTTDITQLDSGGSPGGDLPGSDADFRGAFSRITNAFVDQYDGFLRPFTSGDSPWSKIDVIMSGFSITKEAADSIPDIISGDNADFIYNATSRALTTDGAVKNSNSYFTNFANGLTGLTGVSGVTVTSPYFGGVFQTDSAVQGIFTTPNITTNVPYSAVFVSCVAPFDATGSYQDWTKTENVKVEISNDNGSTWEHCKYIAQDITNETGWNVWGKWVNFADPGSQFKAKITFEAPYTSEAGILSLSATWDYDPSENEYIGDKIASIAL